MRFSEGHSSLLEGLALPANLHICPYYIDFSRLCNLTFCFFGLALYFVLYRRYRLKLDICSNAVSCSINIWLDLAPDVQQYGIVPA